MNSTHRVPTCKTEYQQSICFSASARRHCALMKTRSYWIAPLASILLLACTSCNVQITTETPSGTSTTNSSSTPSTHQARLATYNIQFLGHDADRQGNRVEKLRKLIADINPTVVAVQEVEDRTAMNFVFPPDHWTVVIDDDSPDKQDIAFAVQKPWQIKGIAKDLDADDENFLAPNSRDESYFPNRRDGLFITVVSPDGNTSFTVVNIHAKARVGGRANTDSRREGAARILVEQIRNRFNEKPVAVVGDFNDTPDDTSLNILETGNPGATGGLNDGQGKFMINLTEPLWARGMVSEGASDKRLEKSTGLINNIYPEARERNNRTRNREAGTGPVLIDNILVSPALNKMVVKDSTTIYRKPQALQGPGFTRPSDHLPVYVDLTF